MKSFMCLAACLISGRSFAEESGPNKIERKVSVGGFVDAGQIIQGSLINDDGSGAPKRQDRTFLSRDGVALTYSGVLNENLHMNIGVGGLFWKPIPETTPVSRIQFGPGISEASAQYDFSPRLNLKFGFFGYDYNPDAKNLGEYLLRSEAYPTIIHTAGPGGWVWMNEYKYKSMGAKLSWDLLDGALRQDFLIFSEFWEAPFFDFSPSYVATAKIGKALEIGGGFSLHRWIPIKPSVTTPTTAANAYVEVDSFPAFPAINDDTLLFIHQLAFSGGTLKGMGNQIGTYADSFGTPLATKMTDAQGRMIYVLTSNGDTLRPKVSTALTFKAIKVMARASLNLGGLLSMEEKNSGSFKLFTEVAVLGIENQPYFYDKIQQRIPVMLGADIPTFGLLNLLCLQMEYFKNPYPDNTYQQFTNSLPQPAFPGDNPALYESNKQSGLYGKDDTKWSVFIQKTLFTGLDLFIQAANDHFRVQDNLGQPSFAPVTRQKSDWYYMLRFQWGM